MKEKSAAIGALEEEASREKDRLKRMLEQGKGEADEVTARLREKAEALKNELDAKQKAFDQEKVGCRAFDSHYRDA